MTIPVFEQLYIVSDLHLGGDTGFQIFNQGPRLTAFIQRLAQPSERAVGLVLGGDIVDFLAEKPAKYLDPLCATDKLQRIYEDPAFATIWQALEDFVAQSHVRLVLLLGNHDVELALPHVREWLLDRLSKGDASSRGRITLAFDGAGYACKVGSKRVLCLHGNEVDAWNLVDYRRLLEVSRSLNRGAVPEEWDANAGTRMVIDVMNGVKRKFPMVDLLKPEVEAVAPVILAIDPGQLSKIVRLIRVASYLARDKIRQKGGFLSAEEEGLAAQELPSEAEVARRFLGEHFADYSDRRRENVAHLLQRAYKAIEADLDPKDQKDIQDVEFLGIRESLQKFFRDKANPEEILRHALKRLLRQDQSFEVTFKDVWFQQLDKDIDSKVDYLIAGHTHLERAIERGHPGRYYFNSGTWIRLIQLPDEILDDPKEFSRVYQAFAATSMEVLDGLKDLGPNRNYKLVQNKSTVVSIIHDQGQTYGYLSHARDDGSLEPVSDTRLPRS